MTPGIRAAMLAALAGLGALAPLALAQSSRAADRIFMSNRNDGWTAILISKDCYLLSFIDGLVHGWGGYDDMEKLQVTATGNCNAQGLAEGPVQITYEWQDENGPVRVVNDGTARNGILQGMARQTIFDQFETPGRFSIAELGDVRNPMPSFYKDGCEYFVDSSGRIDYENPSTSGPYGQCLPEGGQFLLNAALTPADTPPNSAPASSGGGSPAQQAGSGDVFSQCITVQQYPRDGGIETIWAMRNICDSKLIVRFCFQANVEAAGDPNLCSRREMRTQEISAGGAYDFAFTPVTEGTAMSDGTIAGPNGLSVAGYACTGGRFPDAYFDNGVFLSRGC